MKAAQILSLFPAFAAAAAGRLAPAQDEFVPPVHLLANPAASTLKIPTSYESAVMARRILALTPQATFSTVFPSEAKDAEGTVVGGVPIGLSDYIADCEEEGNPTILSLRIGTTFRNVQHGSNISVSLNWVPPYPPSRRIRSVPEDEESRGLFSWLRAGRGRKMDAAEERKDPMPYSGANLPRFSLMGYLEKINHTEDIPITACYVATHPDAKYWLPGNPIHEAEWVRLVVTKVYWIGGFGDRAYIGWIPVEEWKSVTRDEWEGIRLPGEKPGWKEWSVDQVGGAVFGDL